MDNFSKLGNGYGLHGFLNPWIGWIGFFIYSVTWIWIGWIFYILSYGYGLYGFLNPWIWIGLDCNLVNPFHLMYV